MDKLIIKGGVPLKGAVKLCGAKNSSYKLMIASLLCSHENRLLNFSRIADVSLVRDIIKQLGAKAYSAGDRTMFVNAKTLTNSVIPKNLGKASRASSMFIAPLLARLKKATVPLPGGDKIGKRPLGWHFDGLRAMGVNLEVKNNMLVASCQSLHGTDYTFPKNSHTGTETLIMAAVLAKGVTNIRNAALEPEVDDLIGFLNKMGAKIKRKPNRIIKIQGVKTLKPVIHQVMPDRNEAVSYAIAGIITKGDVIIENANKDHLKIFLRKLKLAGVGIELGKYGIRIYYQENLRAVDIITKPHPGFATDHQPLWSILATQLHGSSKIIEAVFSSRFQFAKDLKSMGANLKFFDPKPKDPNSFYNFNLEDDNPANQHGMIITGPTPLIGMTIKVTDIRAGATLALAGLAATGTSTLTGLDHIDRGYEDFAGRLLQLGANIKRIKS
ncbi:MAG: UDP-N-acetylglucosamine 1-carboxyvinyltransferase [Candidatus Beckwithbacteria bacterium]|nr:UDP-N-acetylglucosamine 1-carboxyvinyltransferase [Patescibacteria group bacterium]